MQSLDELEGFDQGPGVVLDAYRIQRGRFIESISGFGPAEWQEKSRCTEWSVHEVVRHVRDVAALHVERLGGRAAVLERVGQFHPARTPAVWLTASNGESPAQTMAQFRSLIEEEDALLARKVERNPGGTITGPLRRTLHWSVSSLHSLWDAWMHERDVMLPLGAVPVYTATDLRLATMYGLLGAAAPASWSDDHVRTTVLMRNSPDGCYSIAPTPGGSTTVSVAPDTDPELRGPVEDVLDSLAGRGPEPHEVFGVSTPAVSKLALLRKVVT